ncbi:MAG TPA: enoyl-CoA hydratase-related protein [Candidatus Acidoferrales bacterium]|nr:enoyl-CoA hydratase-related protein [Candidatus Acidoferrales bacterium]
MSYETLTLAYEGLIAALTLDRAEKRNAISMQMMDDLLAALDEMETSPARVGILTGAGKAFCAGMDLEALRTISSQSHLQNLQDSRRMAQLFRRLWAFPKVLIAAVNGPALAGGCGIATLADFTLAAPEATFGYTEVRIGFLPALVSVFLRRRVGEAVARDLLLSGRIFPAAEAQRLGLVSEVVAAEALAGRARELAGTLLANSAASLLATKKLLVESEEPAIDREISLAIEANASIRSTADFREGVSAFLEKRAPKWTGS